MPDNTAQRDRVDATHCPRAEAEIDVFAAVDIAFIESAELLPQPALDDHARAGDGGHGAHGLEPPHEGRWNRTDMKRLSGNSNDQARVVDGTGAGVELDIADCSGAIPQ